MAGAQSYAPLAASGRDGAGFVSEGAPRSSGAAPAVTSRLDLSFVDGNSFQSFIGVVIFLSTFVLWGETDMPHAPAWPYAENVFLVVFLSELIMRIKHNSVEPFFFGKDRWWALLDTAVVGFGVCDLWLAPLWVRLVPGAHPPGSAKLRLLRLVRLLRVVRVFKMFPRLMSFMSALADMFATFQWIFAVLLMLILTFAITFTQLLAHVEAYDEFGEEYRAAALSAQKMFSDVPTSIFTLFELTTMDNWDDIAGPLIKLNPFWRLFFVFFIAVASWAMISVLTAVASNMMISATADRKESEAKEQERRYQAFIEFLRVSFLAADSDGNGVLDREEFATMLKEEYVHIRMKELGVHMTEAEMSKAWEMLDIDESGELTTEEFVTGLSTLQEGLASKHMVSLEYSLKKVTVKAERRVDNFTKEIEELARESSGLHDGILLRCSGGDPTRKMWLQWFSQSSFSSWPGRLDGSSAG